MNETPKTFTWADLRSLIAQSAIARFCDDRPSVYEGTDEVLLLVKAPKTTAETLALAVLRGEPCGRELIDCLIEQGIIDVEAEVIKKAKTEERAAVAREIEQNTHNAYDDSGWAWRDVVAFIRRGIQ